MSRWVATWSLLKLVGPITTINLKWAGFIQWPNGSKAFEEVFWIHYLDHFKRTGQNIFWILKFVYIFPTRFFTLIGCQRNQRVTRVFKVSDHWQRIEICIASPSETGDARHYSTKRRGPVAVWSVYVGSMSIIECFEEHEAEWELKGRGGWMSALRGTACTNVTVVCASNAAFFFLPPDTCLAHENGEARPRERGEKRIHRPQCGDLTHFHR